MIHWRSLELTSFSVPHRRVLSEAYLPSVVSDANCIRQCISKTLLTFCIGWDLPISWCIHIGKCSHCIQSHIAGPDIRSLFVDPGPALALLKRIEASDISVQAAATWCFSEHRLIRLAELLIGWRTLPGLLCDRDIWHLQSGVEKLYQLQPGRHAVRLTTIMHTAECTSVPANVLLCVLFSGWHYILNWHVREQPRQEMTCLSKLFASMW